MYSLDLKLVIEDIVAHEGQKGTFYTCWIKDTAGKRVCNFLFTTNEEVNNGDIVFAKNCVITRIQKDNIWYTSIKSNNVKVVPNISTNEELPF